VSAAHTISVAAFGLLVAIATAVAAPANAEKLVMLHTDMPSLGAEGGPPSAKDFVPAPTPNIDKFPPRAPPSTEAQFGPGIATNQHQVVHPGQGYIAGSAPSDDTGRRHSANPLGVTPTLGFKVPLE
jgi:hypothetical protein